MEKKNTRTFGATLALSAALLSGCATNNSSTNLRPTGDPIADGKAAVAQGPKKDRVLWEYRTGLAALRKGDYAESKAQLDDALVTIGNIFGKDKSARQARGYFHEESKKTFLGEPYERVMAYYYRAILYWMDGEPDNARACYRTAQLLDSDPDNKEYSNDYALLDYLDGFTTVKLKGDGADSFKHHLSVAKLEKLPPYNPKANALFFLEFGKGPTKYATGEHNQELRIRPGQSQARGAVIRIGNQSFRVGAADDLTYQATTRGGRVMDHILANKAVFKNTTDTIGNAAIMSGAAVGMMDRRNPEIALGLVAAGLLSKVVAAATTPAADTRTWDNLPQYLAFTAVELPPGQYTAVVDFVDAGGRVLPAYTKTVNFTVVAAPRDTVIFVSDQSS